MDFTWIVSNILPWPGKRAVKHVLYIYVYIISINENPTTLQILLQWKMNLDGIRGDLLKT